LYIFKVNKFMDKLSFANDAAPCARRKTVNRLDNADRGLLHCLRRGDFDRA